MSRKPSIVGHALGVGSGRGSLCNKPYHNLCITKYNLRIMELSPKGSYAKRGVAFRRQRQASETPQSETAPFPSGTLAGRPVLRHLAPTGIPEQRACALQPAFALPGFCEGMPECPAWVPELFGDDGLVDRPSSLWGPHRSRAHFGQLPGAQESFLAKGLQELQGPHRWSFPPSSPVGKFVPSI